MARPREFDEAFVLAQARALFASRGYNGTSVDDLVKATGLLRGSIYRAFGSKRNLFEKLLADVATDFELESHNLDLLTVALKELASDDKPIRDICLRIVEGKEIEFSTWLGANLLNKMKEN